MKKLFIIAYLLFTSPVHARTIPSFDIEIYCKNVATISGDSTKMEMECKKMEEAEKINISKMSVSADTASYCEEMANFGENSYVFYAKCLRIEIEALEIIGQ